MAYITNCRLHKRLKWCLKVGMVIGDGQWICKLKFALTICRTALHWACRRGHTSIARLLIQSGADVNLRTHNGELPVDVTTTSDIVQLLCGKQLVSTHLDCATALSVISRPLLTPVSASVSLLPGYHPGSLYKYTNT